MTEPVKRKVSFTSNQPSSQDLKQSSENKQKSKRQRIVKEKLEDIPIVTVDSLIDAEPIKIVSRKKSTETSTTGTQSIASHKLGVSTKKAGSKTDVWDIDNAFSLPTISRRSNVTFGKPSMGRRTLASEKAVVFGVDVFSNVKKPLNTTLDKKEDKQIITHKVHTTATTRKKSQKLDHIESLAQPMKSNRRDDDTTDQPKTIKKRSLSSSRNSTNTTNKDLHLKVVVDKKPESPKLTVDSFIFKDGRVLMEERKSKEPESPNLMTDSSTFDHSKVIKRNPFLFNRVLIPVFRKEIKERVVLLSITLLHQLSEKQSLACQSPKTRSCQLRLISRALMTYPTMINFQDCPVNPVHLVKM